MRESTTEVTDIKALYFWGNVEPREVITKDGKDVGIVRGILVDTKNWTIPHLVVEVNNKTLDEFEIKKPLLSVALINLPTKYVQSVSDVVTLKTNIGSMSGDVNIYYREKSGPMA